MNDRKEHNNRKPKRYAISRVVEIYDIQRDIYLGRLVNIHTEGLMLIGDNSMKVDHLYQLELHLPVAIDGREKIQIGVDCLWARRSEDGQKHWAGCKIIDVSDQTLSDINSLIEELKE